MYGARVRPLLVWGLPAAGPGAVALVSLGTNPSLWWTVVGAVVGGVGMGVFGVAWETALARHIPDRELPRVCSYDALGSFLAIPVGSCRSARCRWWPEPLPSLSSVA